MDTYDLIKPILFKLDPELSHNLVTWLLQINPFTIPCDSKPKLVDGISYKNPIGLAAGFDKDGELINHIHKLGFGFMEVGTITPKPQMGNPKPRLFRYIEEKSLFNRMGFNNTGLGVICKRLEKRDGKIIIGGNIGKGFETPLTLAWEDYLKCFKGLKGLVDYITVNISSPNTQNLTELQRSEYLKKILFELQSANVKGIPIYVKISPDLTELDSFIRVIEESQVNGIVATNTKSKYQGGLSGKLITDMSHQMVLKLKGLTNKTIIGSGGVMSEEIVKSRLENGCDLVQVYTGLVYRGPFFIKKCLEILD